MPVPSRMVPSQGVRKRGCSTQNTRGSSPSRAMLKKIRLWPYCSTSITDSSPVTAPSFTNSASHGCPMASTATASGSATPSRRNGTTPTITAATAR